MGWTVEAEVVRGGMIYRVSSFYFTVTLVIYLVTLVLIGKKWYSSRKYTNKVPCKSSVNSFGNDLYKKWRSLMLLCYKKAFSMSSVSVIKNSRCKKGQRIAAKGSLTQKYLF